MRRPTALRLLVVALLVAGAAACSDGGDDPTPTTEDATSTSLGTDPGLEAVLLTSADLPTGFDLQPDVDTTGRDTTTELCFGQSATAGLQATGRAIATFRRNPAGAGLVHVVLRFAGDGAATFVRQLGQVLTECNEVPDLQGRAFTYVPLAPELDAVLATTDGHDGRFGTSVGSGTLLEDIGTFRRGDVVHLLAVITNGSTRADTDALAATAFRAAVAKGT